MKSFFDRYFAVPEESVDTGHQLQLASATLMVELMFADHEVSAAEEEQLRALLRSRFSLTHEETEDLFSLAHDEKHAAIDYYRFTSLLNEHYSQQQKIELIEQLWQIAYADDRLDKFEEHLIRRLSELLHVPHAEFIQAKHRVSGK